MPSVNNYTIYFLIAFAALTACADELKAEALFLRDMTRLEGKIEKEDAARVTIRVSDGTAKVVLRKDISHIAYGDQWKTKKYFYRHDMSYISGHQVDENRDSYIIRPDLNASAESTLSRKEIKFVSTRNISEWDSLSLGKDKKVLPLVDWFYFDLGLQSFSGPTLGFENGYDSFIHSFISDSLSGWTISRPG